MLSWSPLHLLWMFPVSFILGLLSHGFPLSLLMLPGRVFFGLACIGLDREQARKNHVRLEKLTDVVINERVTPKQARELLKQRGEWS